MVAEAAGAPAGTTRSPKRVFFPELEGMRGLAALGVLTTHVAFSSGQLGWADHPGNGVWGILLNKLEVSLPIFFVLSGTLLYRQFALNTLGAIRKPALKPYFWRRFLRVMPGYWLLAVVALPVLNHQYIHSWWQVVRPMLILQVYQHDAYVAGMEQTWSLATEVAFYFTLPLIAWGLHRIARKVADPVHRARRILWSLSVALPIGFAMCWYDHLPSLGSYPIQNTWPIENMGFIAIGMALATMSASAEVAPDRVLAPYRLVVRHPVLCWAGALAVYILCCASPVGDQSRADYPPLAQSLVNQILYLAFGLLAVAPLTVPHARSGFIEAVLTNPLMRYIGRISYGIYLWHIALIYFWNGSLFGAPAYLEAVILPLSIGAATISFYLVENPAMKLRERLGKTTVAPSVASVETVPHANEVVVVDRAA
jgi:peptidoglycan/LPS O-acetylase OafA/YrhL